MDKKYLSLIIGVVNFIVVFFCHYAMMAWGFGIEIKNWSAFIIGYVGMLVFSGISQAMINDINRFK